MLLQEEISKKRLQAKVGKTMRVLVDEVNRNGGVARSAADAPEIDGVVYVKPPYEPHLKLKVGEFIDVKITAPMHMIVGRSMMKKVLLSTLIALAAVSTGVSAQGAAPAAQAAPVPGSNVPVLFHKPVFFRGVVGDINVQVNIRPKADIDEGIEGEYFIFGNSHKNPVGR